MAKPKAQTPPKNANRLATTLSIVAITISGLGGWVSYESSLPAITTTAELLEPLAPGQQVRIRLTIENYGKTTAKALHPTIGWEFSRADIPFNPTYQSSESAGTSKLETISDLAPGTPIKLLSTSGPRLLHDHDVNAVLSGDYDLYFYGKMTYNDMLHLSHEVHFCRYYRSLPGAEPLKLTYCTSYNDAT